MIRQTIAVVALTASSAVADVTLQFQESAPKDLFTITNASSCPTGPLTLTIDLSGSAAGLIFDTTGSGAGVSVFQPLEIASGADYVAEISQITDGDQRVQVRFAGLPGGAKVVLTTDVDDTLAQSWDGQTRVSGAEIAGAWLVLEAGGGPDRSAPFDTAGWATLPWESCLS